MQATSKPFWTAVVAFAVGSLAGTSQAGDLYFLGAPGAGLQLGSIQLVSDAEMVRLGKSQAPVQALSAPGFKTTLGYQLSPSFALESAYTQAKFNAPTFYGLGFIPVSDQFSLFGKVGSSLELGLGGIYQLNDRLGLRAEWERPSSDVNINQFTLGLQARF